MSSYASQLHEEQQAVDRAYGRLDDLRAEMWQRLDTVRAAGIPYVATFKNMEPIMHRI